MYASQYLDASHGTLGEATYAFCNECLYSWPLLGHDRHHRRHGPAEHRRGDDATRTGERLPAVGRRQSYPHENGVQTPSLSIGTTF
jgi:hypothetical protein